jgi:alanine-synthesizing transaminase
MSPLASRRNSIPCHITMPPLPKITPSSSLDRVHYEIRGQLSHRALELEHAGNTIIKLNIGNPGLFGFRAPESMQKAIIAHIEQSDPYCHQKGLDIARAAVVKRELERGVSGAVADDVFIGNGCSELIMFALKALLNPGDEVLVPTPDYPLWTAATNANSGVAVHYPCPPERGFLPDANEIEALVTPRTKALVFITPNNPTGAVYPRKLLEAMVAVAEKHRLVVLSDEIYDEILYDGNEHTPLAVLTKNTLCGTFGGLSKVYRACGYRVGWLSFTGEKNHARDYFAAIELLASLRLCANVTAQWAVPEAVKQHSIRALCSPGGRLYQSRQALIDGAKASKYLEVVAPKGAIYAFVRIKPNAGAIDDKRFALELLEKHHVLVTPGHGFNVPYNDHFRMTLLPDETTMRDVFGRMESLLAASARTR